MLIDTHHDTYTEVRLFSLGTFTDRFALKSTENCSEIGGGGGEGVHHRSASFFTVQPLYSLNVKISKQNLLQKVSPSRFCCFEESKRCYISVMPFSNLVRLHRSYVRIYNVFTYCL